MNKCPACGQFLKSPVTYPLNRNAIGYLIKIFTIIKNSTPQKKYIETKECYRIRFSGSNTAENSQLTYLQALEHYYEGDEESKGVKRSGKWKITDKGILFIIGVGTLPSYVKVIDKKVIEIGKEIKMEDPSLKWFKHADYWENVITDLQSAGVDIHLSKEKKPDDNWRDYVKPDKPKEKNNVIA
jgi:hypothetical protein